MFGWECGECEHEAADVIMKIAELLCHLCEILLLVLEVRVDLRVSTAHLVEAYFQELTVTQVLQVLLTHLHPLLRTQHPHHAILHLHTHTLTPRPPHTY